MTSIEGKIGQAEIAVLLYGEFVFSYVNFELNVCQLHLQKKRTVTRQCGPCMGSLILTSMKDTYMDSIIVPCRGTAWFPNEIPCNPDMSILSWKFG